MPPTDWQLLTPATLGLVAASWGYALAFRAARGRGRPTPDPWRVSAWYSGIALLALALVGPLDAWNDELFTLHMTQHVVLTQLAPPLLLLGQPAQLALRALPPRAVRRGLRPARRTALRWLLTALVWPPVVFVLFNGTLLLWHLPNWYVAALRDPLIHEAEHLTFFASGMLFWWVLVEPVPRHHRASRHWAFLLCVATGMVSDVLGAALTLSTRVLYPDYLAAERPWDISALADQRIAGAIMWLGSVQYFAILFGLLIYSLRDQVERQAGPKSGAAVRS
jgi:cytochrome c oxidase assembly factor CtaG